VRITDNRSGTGLAARCRSAVLAAVALGGLLIGATACDSATKPASHAAAPSPDDSYGSLPSFLPSSAVDPDSVLVATADRPALTTEGDAVRVTVPGGTVLATVTGPQVPGEGLPYQTPATTCTWTVTLSAATAPVAIRIADFTSLDHLGAVYHPILVKGQPKPPAVLQPGQKVTFELRTVMTVGEGLMRWAPTGTPILASWDFEVEND
jgi:hypothetical protein